jgi:hypothetical protein
MNNLKLFFFAIALITMGATHDLHAQNSCEAPNELPLNAGCLSNQNTSQIETWYRFTAQAPQIEINLFNLNCGGTINTIELFAGTCINSQQLATSTYDNGVISLVYNNLINGQEYRVKLTQNSNQNACYTICAENLVWDCKTTAIINGVTFVDCASPPPPPLVCKEDSVTIVPWIQIGSSNTCDTPATWSISIQPGNYLYSIPYNDSLTIVAPDNGTCEQQYNVICTPLCANGDTACGYIKLCPNFVVICRPTATIAVAPNPVCLGDTVVLISTTNSSGTNYMETRTWYIDGNFIYTTTADTFLTIPSVYAQFLLTTGIHTASLLISNGACTDSTSVSFIVNNPDPCFTWNSSCRVNFFGDTTCNSGILSELWDFGDGSPIVTFSNPSHTYPTTGQSYLVTHTIITINGDTLTCERYVTQTGGPVANIQGFAVNNCGNGSITYMANPCTNGIVYTWSALVDTSLSYTGCTAQISWNSSSGDTLILTAWDPINDCYGYDTLIIPPCCFGSFAPSNITYINNTTSSQFIASQNNNNVYSSANQIIINGIFTIDADLTFLNCPNIWMGSNAAIIIQPGTTLTINNSSVIGKCDYMWDGIYIQGTLATLNVINNSFIEQAKQAVVSDNGGVYLVQNSTLRNNLRGIVVNAYSGFHTGVVRATTFSMTSNFLPAIPALPPAYTKTICAVEIYDNASITIGDPTSTALQNTFNNVFVGVRSNNSNTSVFNGRFTNITASVFQTFNIPNAGTAIVATGRRNVNYQASLTVGAQPFSARCNIINVRNGIDVRGLVNTSVQYNTIREIRNAGVRVQLANGRTINVENNTISNQTVNFGFFQGIALVDVPNAWVTITSNTILQTASVPNQLGTGIYVACVSPAAVFGSISNNPVISRLRTGIHLLNIQDKNGFNIFNNNISFTKPLAQFTQTHYGIRLEYCASIRVNNNTVSRGLPNFNPNSNNNLTYINNIRGLSIENSPVTIASNNTFNRMGSGIYGSDQSSSSKLVCNTFNSCIHGVYFGGAAGCDIGDQVLDANGNPQATGNVWNNNIDPFNIAGQVSSNNPIKWFWDVIQPQNGAGFVTCNNTTQTNALVDCSSFPSSLAIIEREEYVGTSLRAGRDTNNLPDRQLQYTRFAYRMLSKNPQWLNLNTPDDTLYQNFYAQYQQQNIGAMRTAEIAADSGNAATVNGICTSLNCTNIQEHNFKLVYEIYSRSWLVDSLQFTSSDSTTLLIIANSDPNSAGRAVYSARVLLDLPIDYFDIISQRYNQLQPEQQESTNLEVYPNPAQEVITIEFDQITSSIILIEIVDITGKTVFRQVLTPGNLLYQVNVHELNPGMYILRANTSDMHIGTSRLIITK